MQTSVKEVQIPILFEDSDIIVVDKPSGVTVNRAESVRGETLQDWAEEKYTEAWKSFSKANHPVFFQRSGFAHRLDKETSGVLLLAKNPPALEALLTQFHDRTIEKTYCALVHGKLPARAGTIQASVGRLPWNRERFGVLPGGREAETLYSVLSEYIYQGDVYTYVQVSPKTGRTHQIRIHLKYIGHPIVSDPFYAGRKTVRRDRMFCPRLFLHAHKITFTHPKKGERMTVKSPLPEDLQRVLTTICLN